MNEKKAAASVEIRAGHNTSWRGGFQFKFLGQIHSDVDDGDGQSHCEEAWVVVVSRNGKILGETEVQRETHFVVAPFEPRPGDAVLAIQVIDADDDHVVLEISEAGPDFEGKLVPYEP